MNNKRTHKESIQRHGKYSKSILGVTKSLLHFLKLKMGYKSPRKRNNIMAWEQRLATQRPNAIRAYE